ncbi:MAG TPA: hypothetical protein VH107_15405, partial [Lacipirellulaceae bacterium]|nr:hypothetical protein [Lacipirellulaceae bacterium]
MSDAVLESFDPHTKRAQCRATVTVHFSTFVDKMIRANGAGMWAIADEHFTPVIKNADYSVQ